MEQAALESNSSAVFEPHGSQVCASGCALSQHPTARLSVARYRQLLAEYAVGPLDSSNAALETLLYFGPQTRSLLEGLSLHGLPDRDGPIQTELDTEHRELLSRELNYSHARISLRVVDEFGVVRSWLQPTVVPLDRRHVFKMQVNQLPDLQTSGTVKRVGLEHLWTRL